MKATNPGQGFGVRSTAQITTNDQDKFTADLGQLPEANPSQRESIRERWAEGRSSAWNPPEKYWLGGALTPWWEMCPRCEVQGLWAPRSQKRGYCERCHLDGVTA